MLTRYIKWIFLLSLLFILVMIGAVATSSTKIKSPVNYSVSFIKHTAAINQLSDVVLIPSKQWNDAKNSEKLSTEQSTYWLKIEPNLSSADVKQQQWFLTINTLLIDRLIAYTLDSSHLNNLHFINTKAPLDIATNSHIFVLPLNAQKNGKAQAFIKYTGMPPVHIDVSLVNNNDYIAMLNQQMIMVGIVIGLLLLAIAQAVFSYLTFKVKQYFYFSGYLISVTVLLIHLNGFTEYLVWSKFALFSNFVLPIIAILGLFLSVKTTLSAKGFLLNNKRSKLIEKTFSLGLLCLSLLTLLIPPFITILLIVGFTLIISLTLTTFCCKLVYQKKKFAKHHLFAWLFLSTGIALATLKYSGIHHITPSLLSLFSVGVFSQLVAYYVMLTKQTFNERTTILVQRHTAQEQLQQFKELREIELRQEQKHQLDLEAVVDERTFELNMTLRELQDTNRRLEEQSTIDALTGAKNRKFFDSQYQAEQRLSRRQQTPLALLILDADHFKAVNDNYGHLAGDKVLIEICKRAESILKRPNDYVCRYGGEEFAILLPNTEHDGAIKIAEQIRLNISQTPIHADSHQLTVTVSIGISCTIVESGLNSNAMFLAADKALYKAKELGRNQVVMAQPCSNNPQHNEE